MKLQPNQRRKIGFIQGYMTKKDTIITNPLVENNNPLLDDLKEQIAEQILYMASPKFAKLTKKTKCKKILKYNLLVKIEAKLSNEIPH